jgi:uncharacterized membrane protein YeaQ/YmgE (transglycosylase-associated protein family)
MQLILFLLFGFVVGLIARAILPGSHHMGVVKTTILGIVGSLFGGFVASHFTGHNLEKIDSAGIVGSILGALVVLAVAAYIGKRRGGATPVSA